VKEYPELKESLQGEKVTVYAYLEFIKDYERLKKDYERLKKDNLLNELN
jgi:hypothetical protein